MCNISEYFGIWTFHMSELVFLACYHEKNLVCWKSETELQVRPLFILQWAGQKNSNGWFLRIRYWPINHSVFQAHQELPETLWTSFSPLEDWSKPQEKYLKLWEFTAWALERSWRKISAGGSVVGSYKQGAVSCPATGLVVSAAPSDGGWWEAGINTDISVTLAFW